MKNSDALLLLFAPTPARHVEADDAELARRVEAEFAKPEDADADFSRGRR